MPSEKSFTKNRTILDARRDPKLDAANSQAQIWPEPHSYQPSAFAASVSLSTRMTELAVARLGTIVRLGEALPVVFFSPDAARTAVVDRRQLTGKMKSTALEKNTTGSASPRRTIVPVSATRESMCPMCNAAARSVTGRPTEAGTSHKTRSCRVPTS